MSCLKSLNFVIIKLLSELCGLVKVSYWYEHILVNKIFASFIDVEYLSTQFKKQIQLSDDNELTCVIRGLRLLQTIYNLSVDETAKGEKYG